MSNNELIADFLGWLPPSSKLMKIKGFWLDNRYQKTKPDFLNNHGQSLVGFTKFRNWIFEESEMGDLLINEFIINMNQIRIQISDGASIFSFSQEIEFDFQSVFYNCLLSFAQQFKNKNKSID